MLFERLIERRATVSIIDPRDPVLAQWFGMLSNTAAGVSVTPDLAKRVAAVYTCVRIIAESIASLPLNIYRRLPDGKGKELAFDHPLFGLLHDAPNRFQTSYEWREMMAGHVALRGNAYSEIRSSGYQAVAELWPLHPDRVRPIQLESGDIVYQYRPKAGAERIILAQDMLHFRGFSDDGVKGDSVIEQNKEAIGLAMAAEQFGAAFFGNGSTIGGVLEYPKGLSDQSYDRLKKSFAENFQGSRNANKPLILEDGLTWKAIGIEPNKAQFLETRKFQISEIARMFRIPPHMLADLEKATFSNIEQQSLEFIRDTLRPWLVRMEQRMNADLLSAKGRSTYFIEFSVDGVTRGDSAARTAYYNSMFNMGAISPNEIRARENMNPIKGGDVYYVNSANAPTGGEDIDDPETDPDDDQDSLRRRVIDAQFPALRQAVDKIVTAEIKALRRAAKDSAGDMGKFEKLSAEFFNGHRRFIERQITPVASTITSTRQALGAGGCDIAEYVKSYADVHMNESIEAVRGALLEGENAITQMLDRWEYERVPEIVTREIKLASRFEVTT